MSLKKIICELVDDPVVTEAISKVRIARDKNFTYRHYWRPKEIQINEKSQLIPSRSELGKIKTDASSKLTLNRKENKSESRI